MIRDGRSPRRGHHTHAVTGPAHGSADQPQSPSIAGVPRRRVHRPADTLGPQTPADQRPAGPTRRHQLSPCPVTTAAREHGGPSSSPSFSKSRRAGSSCQAAPSHRGQQTTSFPWHTYPEAPETPACSTGPTSEGPAATATGNEATPPSASSIAYDADSNDASTSTNTTTSPVFLTTEHPGHPGPSVALSPAGSRLGTGRAA